MHVNKCMRVGYARLSLEADRRAYLVAGDGEGVKVVDKRLDDNICEETHVGDCGGCSVGCGRLLQDFCEGLNGEPNLCNISLQFRDRVSERVRE